MKRSLMLASLLSVSLLAPAIAAADPGSVKIEVRCPLNNDAVSMLSNGGTYVGGFGQETIANQNKHDVYFTSTSLPDKMPSSLVYYINDKAIFDSPTSTVICSYRSTAQQPEPSFSVSYKLRFNAIGGVAADGVDSVYITLPMGFARG